MPVEQGEVLLHTNQCIETGRFKRAVKRNRVKRQIREAYRKNKLYGRTVRRSKRWLAVAFIYLSDELIATSGIEEKDENSACAHL